MFDFTSLIAKYSTEILIHEESGGSYDYENGGVWKAEASPRAVAAAVFNLSSKDINTAIRYGEGGAFAKGDIKIYTHEQLPIGTKLTHKDRRYIVSAELDYSDHAHGLRVYFAKGASGINDVS